MSGPIAMLSRVTIATAEFGMDRVTLARFDNGTFIVDAMAPGVQVNVHLSDDEALALARAILANVKEPARV